MTEHTPIQLLADSDEHRAKVGTSMSNRMTRQCGFTELSAGFTDFTSGGETEPWTAPYEEVLYVISGRLDLRTSAGQHLTGHPGDVLTIEKGATVTYQGAPGTRLFFALTPANWMETTEARA